MVDVTRSSQSEVAGMVVLLVESCAIGMLVGTNTFPCAKHRKPHGMAGEVALRVQLVDIVIGSVFRTGDLLDNHLTLGVNGILRECGLDHHFGQNGKRVFKLIVNETGVVAGVLLSRERVELSPQAVEMHGDVKRALRGRTFEHHMLHEMGKAGLIGSFVARAHIEPKAQRNRANVRHGPAYHRHAVVEYGFTLLAHARLTLPARYALMLSFSAFAN